MESVGLSIAIGRCTYGVAGLQLSTPPGAEADWQFAPGGRDALAGGRTDLPKRSGKTDNRSPAVLEKPHCLESASHSSFEADQLAQQKEEVDDPNSVRCWYKGKRRKQTSRAGPRVAHLLWLQKERLLGAQVVPGP